MSNHYCCWFAPPAVDGMHLGTRFESEDNTMDSPAQRLVGILLWACGVRLSNAPLSRAGERAALMRKQDTFTAVTRTPVYDGRVSPLLKTSPRSRHLTVNSPVEVYSAGNAATGEAERETHKREVV